MNFNSAVAAGPGAGPELPGRLSESAGGAPPPLDGPGGGGGDRVVKPRDRRLDRLTKKRRQFSARSQSSQWSEGSFDAAESGTLRGGSGAKGYGTTGGGRVWASRLGDIGHRNCRTG